MLSKKAILDYLALPERPSPKEMKELVKAYLASLTSEEQKALVKEESPTADYASEIEFLRRVGFTSLEASWYAGVGLDTPGIRRLVARRALMYRRSTTSSSVVTAYDFARLEKEALGGLTDEQVLEELKK